MRRAALAVIAAAMLAVSLRALKADRWSGWDFGDAQTLLCLNQWDKHGILTDKFLFSPQGYAPFMQLLDREPLRRHARGISPRASSAGPRLLYTHYPSGYLLPQAAAYFAGFKGPGALRLLQSAFSCAALILLFLVFESLAGPAAGLAGIVFYALSPGFMNFADSLANQPLDDLLRFAFMLLILRKRYLWGWLCLFALSLCSYDSVLFCLLWVPAADFIAGTDRDFRRYAAFAAAPMLAGCVQLAQNAWYLGFADAAADMKSTFLLRAMTHSGLKERLANMAYPYYHSFGLYGLIALAAGCGAFFAVRADGGKRAAIALLACGAVFMLALPSAASLSYQTRQLMPFFAFCFAAAMTQWREISARTAAALLCGVLALFLLRLPGSFGPVPLTRDRNIALARALDKLPAEKPAVLFETGFFGDNGYWEKDYVRGYHQPHPLLEYYFGKKLILSFSDPHDLARDMRLILDGSGPVFTPIIAAKDKKTLDAATAALKSENIIKNGSEARVFGVGDEWAAVVPL